MKKVKILLLCLTMTLAFTACGTSGDSESTGTDDSIYKDIESVVLVAEDSTAQGAAGQLWGEYVAKRVAELTEGKLTIDYHPNGELGGDSDLLRQNISGDIDIVVCQTAPVVSFIPEMAVFDLPMVFSVYNAEEIDNAINEDNEFSESLGEAYENQGLQLLGFLQNATYRLTTANKPLRTLEDFKGLQIRTMENANHMAFWTAIGAEPTPLAWAEVYMALQNGTIDAQENAADTCYSANFQDVQKYLCLTNHILYCNQMCINKDTYDSLDDLYKEALDTAVSEATAYVKDMLLEMDEENKSKLEEAGMEIIEYENYELYDEIMELYGVKELYVKIDDDTNGLASKLFDALG